MLDLFPSDYAHICDGSISADLFERAYNYLIESNMIPYGVAIGRTGDSYEFVLDYLTTQYEESL